MAEAKRGVAVGLPRMHEEAGERRAFLPSLVAFLDRIGVEEIVLEEGYGAGMGLSPGDYLSQSNRARFGSSASCLGQDVVAMLRCPRDERFLQMRPGAILVAMLHLDTRPKRVKRLREVGLQAVSLDLVADDLGRRLVENLEAVALNGVGAALRQLRTQMPDFMKPGRGPLRLTILGAGAVGAHAARVGARYADPPLRTELAQRGVPGVEVVLIDAELAADESYLMGRLSQTDLLVDATRRRDLTRPVVRNAWLAELPQHAVVLDLTADPYDLDRDPPQVKGLEGVPHGSLDQYLFLPGDPAFGALTTRVPHAVQRTSLSCYSWPGIQPRSCMEVYSKQVEPVLRAVVERGIENLKTEGGTWIERAVARASLSRWVASA